MSPSTRRLSVVVYVSEDPDEGTTVVFGYMEVACERYDPNIYRCIHTEVYRTRHCKLVGVGWTSIGTLWELWVGCRRDTGSDSDWGEYLRTTGSPPHNTMAQIPGFWNPMVKWCNWDFL
jgi:hypothetical protein